MNVGQGLVLDTTCLLNDWGVKNEEITSKCERIQKSASLMDRLRKDGKYEGSKVLFPHLPYVLEESVLIAEEEKDELKHLKERAKNFDVLILIGIGGSYLGNQVLFDMFLGSYWNERTKGERNGVPKVYFAGQNMDATSLSSLVEELRRCASHMKRKPKVALLVISKSGGTLEPTAAFKVLEGILPDFCDVEKIAITDAEKGWLREDAKKEGFSCFTVPDGIGGRYSVFSQVGLVFAQMVGIPIEEFLAGAKEVEEACQSSDVWENPALLLATLKTIATEDHGIVSEVIMPYGDSLRSLAWWYAQLLGESLGKNETGRTPIATVGTTDMHSLTQEHQQGKRNKLLQFISIEKTEQDLLVPCEKEGKKGLVPMSFLLKAARESNEKALASDHRMSCHLLMKEKSPFCLGSLLYFFFLTVVYEGFLTGVNPFDQPGVEAYKKILHQNVKDYVFSHGE